MNSDRLYIPELCRNSNVFIVLILAQIVAVLVSLLLWEEGSLFKFGLTSLYFSWCFILAAACLCLLRRRIHKLDNRLAFIFSFGICFLCFIVTEVASQMLVNPGLLWFDWARLIRHSLIAIIASLVTLRCFSLIGIHERRAKSEANNRVAALQNRIRPHFLFNSLNTIAELVHVDADHADKAIDSLALLFRASLENERRFHKLENELSLCHRYIELERWRLQDRLHIEWNVQVQKDTKVKVPKLILQPLIENAIRHGVTEDGSISVTIDVRETSSDLSLMVKNLKGVQPAIREGHGIAVDNIRERLFVLYDDQQTFRVKESKRNYSVIMRFPKQVAEAIT